MLDLALWVIIGYLSGSMMYSRLIATHILRVDIYAVGDGNPGTFNVGRAGGVGWAVTAFIMDVLKAAVPVGIAYLWLGISDWRIAFIGIAPALGHAYPLFFGFRGGKGIAAVSGGWVGLALGHVITVGGLLLAFWYFSVKESAWATIFMGISTGLYLLLIRAPGAWFGYWLACLAFLLWTHRRELSNPPGVQPWVENVVGLWHR
jgi:acyl phosphate:glycerol-3-phosphate acyltransferase